MNKYLMLAAGLVLVGAGQMTEAMRHRRMTQAERIANAKARVGYNEALLDAAKKAGLERSNVAAFKYAEARLSGSQTRLKNVESGKVAARRAYARGRARQARTPMAPTARGTRSMRNTTRPMFGRTTARPATARASAARATSARSAAAARTPGLGSRASSASTAKRPGLADWFRRKSAPAV